MSITIFTEMLHVNAVFLGIARPSGFFYALKMKCVDSPAMNKSPLTFSTGCGILLLPFANAA